jgi:hypothetical protein
MEFCGWFLHMCDERQSFPDFFVWSHEAIFKISGTVNQHNCVYWTTKNSQVTEQQAVNLAGVSLYCGLSSRGLTRPFCF